MKIRPKKNEKAITLIALVVTIVVLLILTGVSISMLGGENGIIKQANKSKESTEIGEEREYVDLAVQNIMLVKKANNSTTAISEIELQNEMNKTAGIGKTTVSTNEEGKLVVKYNNSNREYPVDPGDGEVEINWEEVLKTATKHPEQSDTNNNIGVGTDGKPVNMDWWCTTTIGENAINLDYYDTCGGNPSYIGPITEDGRIQGKIPQYIKLDGESDFRIVIAMTDTFSNLIKLTTVPEIPNSVIVMQDTFFGCIGLKQAPQIPNSVIAMTGTFIECSSLITAPKIPNSVINMSDTFARCSSLTIVPEIPDGVTNMEYTFSGCTNLTIAPLIPNSVTNLSGTFCGWSKMTTPPEIPDSVTNMNSTFLGCSSLTTAPEIPNNVTDMYGTFSGCSSLIIAPQIPNSVTNMALTFSECTNLIQASEIPSNVTNMFGTFSECSNLTGNLIINANPTYYPSCLAGASTNAGTNLLLKGTSTKLQEILNTKSSNSNITLGE